MAEPIADPAARALVALAAVTVRTGAVRLLARLGGGGADAVREEGTRLAALPRKERLLALSEWFASDAIVQAERAAALASTERRPARVALRALSSGGGGVEVRPALRRLVRERTWGTAG